MLPCFTPSIRPCPTQTPFLSHNQNRQCLCNFNKFNLLYDYLSTSLTVGSSEYGDSNSKFNYNSDSNSSQRVKKRFSRVAFYTMVFFDPLLASDNLPRAARRCVTFRAWSKENHLELSLESCLKWLFDPLSRSWIEFGIEFEIFFWIAFGIASLRPAS